MFGSLLLHTVQGNYNDQQTSQFYTVSLQVESVRIKSVNTTVGISYGTSLVMMEREELAFPLPSLIADCGGILGLFVGIKYLNNYSILTYIHRLQFLDGLGVLGFGIKEDFWGMHNRHSAPSSFLEIYNYYHYLLIYFQENSYIL